jgi:hypothetical protein
MVPHLNRTYLDGSSVLWVDGEDALRRAAGDRTIATRCAIPKTRLPASALTRARQKSTARRWPRGLTTASPLQARAPFLKEVGVED